MASSRSSKAPKQERAPIKRRRLSDDSIDKEIAAEQRGADSHHAMASGYDDIIHNLRTFGDYDAPKPPNPMGTMLESYDMSYTPPTPLSPDQVTHTIGLAEKQRDWHLSKHQEHLGKIDLWNKRKAKGFYA